MANYNTNLIPWGDNGSQYPSGYSYLKGEQPVDDWDNFFNSNTYTDLDHLITLTNKRIESDYGASGNQPGSPDSANLYLNTDTSTVQVWDTGDSTWDPLAERQYTNEEFTAKSSVSNAVSNYDYVRLLPNSTTTISSLIRTSDYTKDKLVIDARGATINSTGVSAFQLDDGTQLKIIGGVWEGETIATDSSNAGDGGRLIVKDSVYTGSSNAVLLGNNSMNGDIDVKIDGGGGAGVTISGTSHDVSVRSINSDLPAIQVSSSGPLKNSTLFADVEIGADSQSCIGANSATFEDVDISLSAHDSGNSYTSTIGVDMLGCTTNQTRVNRADIGPNITTGFDISSHTGTLAVRYEDGSGKPIWKDGETATSRSSMTTL